MELIDVTGDEETQGHVWNELRVMACEPSRRLRTLS